MLYNISSEIKEITNIPKSHKKEYRHWQKLIGGPGRKVVFAEFDRVWTGKRIDCSSFLPRQSEANIPKGTGADWRGTPYDIIYQSLLLHYVDEDVAWEKSRFCFGLMLWEWMINSDRHWGFGKYEEALGVRGTVYFEINPDLLRR